MLPLHRRAPALLCCRDRYFPSQPRLTEGQASAPPSSDQRAPTEKTFEYAVPIAKPVGPAFRRRHWAPECRTPSSTCPSGSPICHDSNRFFPCQLEKSALYFSLTSTMPGNLHKKAYFFTSARSCAVAGCYAAGGPGPVVKPHSAYGHRHTHQ